jgi:hypothetical protein
MKHELLDFRFQVRWPETPTAGGERLLDASEGRLSIGIQDVSVTAFKSDKGDTGTELSIPLYNVAEWIAANWWSLLFEPRKTDQLDHMFMQMALTDPNLPRRRFAAARGAFLGWSSEAGSSHLITSTTLADYREW